MSPSSYPLPTGRAPGANLDDEDWVPLSSARYLTGRGSVELQQWTTGDDPPLVVRPRSDASGEDSVSRFRAIELANRVDGLDRPLDGNYAAALVRLYGFQNTNAFLTWVSPLVEKELVNLWVTPKGASRLQSDLFSMTDIEKHMPNGTSPMNSSMPMHSTPAPLQPVQTSSQTSSSQASAPPAQAPAPVAAPAAAAPTPQAATPAAAPAKRSTDQLFISILLKAARRTVGSGIAFDDEEVGAIVDALDFRHGHQLR